MRVTLLGTGCPSVDTDRFGPGLLVGGADVNLLVDCGSGVTQRLVAAGCPGTHIDALLLTHLHSDHLVDLYQLIVSSWHAGRHRPQRVIGPPGTRAYVEGLMALWAPERELRIVHERRPSTAAFEIEVEEIAGGQTLAFGGMTVEVVRVDHRPVRDAFGFVFAEEGARVAVSGDTTYCMALIEAARDADLLVHEVFIHSELEVVPGVRTAETIANVASYHTLSDVVGKVAAEANARCLMLTHFVPPRFDRRALLAEVRESYLGPVLIGEDLMSFDTGDRSISHDGAVLALGG
ncbi:MAG: MBL fold metallo-hydrolase [Gammaproteobacteria bacterium]|nr:MBL fold metallo-hydrolase [Gammaproteobacteria bacterium]